MGYCLFYQNAIVNKDTPAINPIMNPTMIIIITAIIAITRAFIQPQSKKCLIKNNHITKTIIEPMIPDNKALSAPPITEPRITIQIASLNFALSPPTILLPANQTTKEFTTIVITMPISKNKISEISNQIHLPLCLNI